MNKINRRSLVKAFPLFGAAIVTPPAIASGQPLTAQLTAVPTDVVDKIKAWQSAHRASVKARNAYCDSLRVKPLDKAECDRCWEASVAANAEVGPAREAMIFALWTI